MKNKILIHVGYPKAASSYIKRKYLSKFSEFVIIPRNQHLNEILKNNADIDKIRQILPTHAGNEKEDSPLIISNEMLAGKTFWTIDGATDAAKNLNKAFPDAKILILLREQRSYIESAYKYSINNGAYLPEIDKFYSLNKEHILKKLQYNDFIKLYVNLFGEDNVCVLPYEMLKKNENEFRHKLTDFTGFEYLAEGVTSIKNRSPENWGIINFTRRINLFLNLIARLEFKLKINNQVKHNHIRDKKIDLKYYKKIRLILSKVFYNENEYVLPDYMDKQSIKLFSDGNRKAEKYLGFSLSEYGYL